jgi:hypothetical protein
MKRYPKEFLQYCQSITAKRAKTVIDHLIKHGTITTEQLKDVYGYEHPPRAIRDVKEFGIVLKKTSITGQSGRKIAQYQFADPSKQSFRKIDGRTGLSKTLKDALIKKYGCRCFIYLEECDPKDLQIDHRVPYEIAGDSQALNPDGFMLLCGSANRAKSWSCEHCENWASTKDKKICLSCYWAFPENYTHVAMRQIRRLDLMWQGDEVASYDRLKSDAKSSGQSVPDFVKAILSKFSL